MFYLSRTSNVYRKKTCQVGFIVLSIFSKLSKIPRDHWANTLSCTSVFALHCVTDAHAPVTRWYDWCFIYVPYCEINHMFNGTPSPLITYQMFSSSHNDFQLVTEPDQDVKQSSWHAVSLCEATLPVSAGFLLLEIHQQLFKTDCVYYVLRVLPRQTSCTM